MNVMNERLTSKKPLAPKKLFAQKKQLKQTRKEEEAANTKENSDLNLKQMKEEETGCLQQQVISAHTISTQQFFNCALCYKLVS